MIAVITKEKVALPDGVKVLSPRRPDEIADFIEAKFLSCSGEMVIDKALAEVQNRFTTKSTKSTKDLKGLCID